MSPAQRPPPLSTWKSGVLPQEPSRLPAQSPPARPPPGSSPVGAWPRGCGEGPAGTLERLRGPGWRAALGWAGIGRRGAALWDPGTARREGGWRGDGAMRPRRPEGRVGWGPAERRAQGRPEALTPAPRPKMAPLPPLARAPAAWGAAPRPARSWAGDVVMEKPRRSPSPAA